VRRQYRLPSLFLSPGQITLGSADDCAIRLSGDGVMPHHCRIESSPEGTFLFAENARTWHNEGPVKETELRPGDRLAIGPVEFHVRLATAEELLRLIPDEFAEPAQQRPSLNPNSSGNRGEARPPKPAEENVRELRQAILPAMRPHLQETQAEACAFEGDAQTDAVPGLSDPRILEELASAEDQLRNVTRALQEAQGELLAVQTQAEAFRQEASQRQLALEEAAAKLAARERELS
jgi:hypothetical protein